jgi:1-acyl-sn-glycerol-3-phosphate acyltransferase
MNHWLNQRAKEIFFGMIHLMALSLLGLRIRHRERLPIKGPAIIVANHNSHLDTLILMSLFPRRLLSQVRPVADEGYFLGQSPKLAWFATHILNIIPVTRGQADRCSHRSFLQRCHTALAQEQILILYPEGSRGEPETLSTLQSGIAHLAKQHPTVPIVPIFLQGLGKALPKGEWLLVPFLCRGVVGKPLYWQDQKSVFMTLLSDRLHRLSMQETFPIWE